jgi:3-hydroxybutyryl-CoA dehydrogenase
VGEKIKKITIIGAGIMGHALAIVFAKGGLEVFLTDIDRGKLDQAKNLIKSFLVFSFSQGLIKEPPEVILERIKTAISGDSVEEKSDLIIEAIIEDVEAKRELFYRLARDTGPETIFASNTSYLDVFPLAPNSIQERLLITHFFSPPYLIPLVEIVGGSQTNPTAVDKVTGLMKDIGMTPVILKKFLPGFIVNRIQRAIGREALYLIDEGFAEPAEIDRAIKASVAIRLPILGIFGRYDFAGLDMAVRALKAPSLGLATEDRLSPRLQELVAEGHLGVKSGRGFYNYGDRPATEVFKERDAKLIKIIKLLRELEEI